MAFSLRITDQNGHGATRELSAKTRAKAWEAYTALWDNYAIRSVELWQDDCRINRTEHKMAGTPEAYRISTT